MIHKWSKEDKDKAMRELLQAREKILRSKRIPEEKNKDKLINGLCCVDGCNNPRFVDKVGRIKNRCEHHFNEFIEDVDYKLNDACPD